MTIVNVDVSANISGIVPSLLAITDSLYRVQFLAPDLYAGKGGIQVFSRFFLNALCELVPAKNLQVLVKNDPESASPDSTQFGYYKAVGDWPAQYRTTRFAFEGLSLTWRERPKLIVATHLHFGPLARIIKKIFGIPYVLVAHGIDAWSINQPQRINALREADLVLAVSHYTRDCLLERLELVPERLKILPNTVAPERFLIQPKSERLMSRYGFTHQNKIILMVCRLAQIERYKGYDQLVAALPVILQSVPTARFLLVGNGPDRSRVEKLIAQAGVQEAVVFAGFVPDDELPEHYNLCDLFAMPSKAEGFGIVYLEALACGKPVLAGNKDGSRDALANGELGVLIDPDNIAEIANSIIQLLQGDYPHPLVYQPEQLRQRVIELFGFETFKKTLHQHLIPFLFNNNSH
jgi:glycosyltransferase involved in cell wall biosynthesis